MSVHVCSHAQICGIASAVPAEVQTNAQRSDDFEPSWIARISQQIGVQERRVARHLCTSDLCYAAAKQLLSSLSWAPDTIDVLLFVSQTPDYRLPATACSLQGRLGLSKHCVAFDINLGCSGYVYGLWIAAQLLSSSRIRRILLLVGDTASRFVSQQDITTALLFGDAGTATALEFDDDASPMFFDVGTDGTGESHLMIPAGGYRQPSQEHTKTPIAYEANKVRSAEDLWMDGAEVFAFTLREIPKSIRSVLASAQWTTEQLDVFVPHQANAWMLQQLCKRVGLPAHKMLNSLQHFGNTSSASIPLAMTTALPSDLCERSLRLLLSGFGVGWSWATVAFLSTPMIVLPPVYLEETERYQPAWLS